RPGELLKAQIRLRQLDKLGCSSDHHLLDGDGRLRIAIEGWQTRRFQMDQRFWEHSRQLDRYEVAQFVPPNVALFEDRYDSAIMRDYIARRYLTESEREIYDGLAPRRRRQWLNGRVAAKDAVRRYLRERGLIERMFPQEIRIENADSGAPRLRANISGRVP